VSLKIRDGCSERYIPTPWLGGPPFPIELRTLHVDRVRRDQEIQKMASDHGVTQVNEKTVRAEKLGRKMLLIHTAGAARLSAS
jgi:hypothetical protein